MRKHGDRFQQQRDAGSRFAASGLQGTIRLSASPCTAGYRRPIETTNEFARIKF
jgi:hypothetical protein